MVFRLLALGIVCLTVAFCVVERGWPWTKK